MAHSILPLVVAIACGGTVSPKIDLLAVSKDPVSCMKLNPSLILIARSEGPADGPDPHGKDPHDEYHDKKLPARDNKLPAERDKDEGRAPKDPYGDLYPNKREPY